MTPENLENAETVINESVFASLSRGFDPIFSAGYLYPYCQQWNPNWQPAQEVGPVTSDVPAWVLFGSNDPIILPDEMRSVAEHLPNSFTVEFPNTGHLTVGIHPCSAPIAQAFLDDPATAPDTSCIDTYDYMTFVLPEGQ